MAEYKITATDGKSYKLSAESHALAKQKAMNRGVDVARVELIGGAESGGGRAGVGVAPTPEEASEVVLLAIDNVGQAVRQFHAGMLSQSKWYDDKKAVYRVIRNAAFTALLMFLVGLVAIMVCGYIVLAAFSSRA